VTTPAVAHAGVSTRGVNPGDRGTREFGAGVTTQSITAPAVATAAPGVGGLPHGYYTTIPSTAVQVMHRGSMCYAVAGVYYRPEYYLGSLVYVVVP
jgi:hypothetical protein